MNKLLVKKFVLGMVGTNCYIIINTNNNQAIIVDPADDADIIEEYIKKEDLKCKGILLTHGHFDHIGAAEELAESFGVEIYAFKEEAELLADKKLNFSIGVGQDISLTADVLLVDKQKIELAGFDIKVLHTPGHTKGSACYLFIDEDIILTGDTLFFENIGRCDLPTGNFEEIINSLNSKLMILDNNIRVYPGHGELTDIGHEKLNNPYVEC
ncbi:MAG TPA: MBL fold metallo-hydrolase [Clostridiales bacterium]|nr:MBL fold metallo-hydrolase [Clostridiales bacterium]